MFKVDAEFERLFLSFIPEKNLRSDITIFLGLVPCLADNTAFLRTKKAGAFFIRRDGGYASGNSGYRRTRLKTDE